MIFLAFYGDANRTKVSTRLFDAASVQEARQIAHENACAGEEFMTVCMAKLYATDISGMIEQAPLKRLPHVLTDDRFIDITEEHHGSH